eukprot:651218-Rhodomonas_salina.1
MFAEGRASGILVGALLLFAHRILYLSRAPCLCGRAREFLLGGKRRRRAMGRIAAYLSQVATHGLGTTEVEGTGTAADASSVLGIG